ncbi:18136_t:CDS:2 [Entrophospora sp. SA101]|nr:5534_t:CDS:2 [Entrophospora candida]CAH1755923.1 13123_t:CDS:2 [Entrophospora sp. SA101]CAG8492679.1 376_t:CDS:2 [Entrophospora candida]CAJ0749392.1 18136_t:CDS:2 [Entrophospora sp. SA101]CAJ0838847.1 2316_t:CDS:2 [Entrophospora sp. SA101]
MTEMTEETQDAVQIEEQVEHHEENTEDAEALEAMKQRVKEMEEEAAKLREMQAQVEKEMNLSAEDKEAIDARSIYVGNVDYACTPQELQNHFQSCGTINRVTILCDKWSGHPKGYAYVEFADPSLVTHAMLLDNTLLHGRHIKVTAKRTNVPGYSRGRGRGVRGGSWRGGYFPPGTYYGTNFRGGRARRATFAPY